MRPEAKHCDVCEIAKPCETTASGLAPVSYSKCSKCAAKNAEPLGLVLFWMHFHSPQNDLSAFNRSLVSYHEGSYIGWHTIKRHYDRHKESIKADINKEFDV